MPNDLIFDESGVDKIHFNSSVNKSDILFSYKDNDLEINYGNEKITIQNQKNSLSSIEKVELSNGNYLSNSDIDLLIQQISAFGQENGIGISNSQDVKQNTQLMTIITNSWKVA